jgi:hypothetical protein
MVAILFCVQVISSGPVLRKQRNTLHFNTKALINAVEVVISDFENFRKSYEANFD